MDLKELGLTANEIKAYEVVLRLSKAPASQISKESQVPYGRIYTVLDSLEEKGLVQIIPEKTKKYAPTDPTQLHAIVTEKITKLQQLDKKLDEFKQLYAEHHREPIMIAKGKNSFHKINSETKPPQHYEYNIRYHFDSRPEFTRRAKEKIAERVEIKNLGRIDPTTQTAVLEWSKITRNIKSIPNEGIALSIIDDEELMIGMIQSNTTVLIRDKPFVKLMKELFLRYYETQPSMEFKKNTLKKDTLRKKP